MNLKLLRAVVSQPKIKIKINYQLWFFHRISIILIWQINFIFTSIFHSAIIIWFASDCWIQKQVLSIHLVIKYMMHVIWCALLMKPNEIMMGNKWMENTTVTEKLRWIERFLLFWNLHKLRQYGRKETNKQTERIEVKGIKNLHSYFIILRNTISKVGIIFSLGMRCLILQCGRKRMC